MPDKGNVPGKEHVPGENMASGRKTDGAVVGTGVGFNRIRRITGYLVGDVKARFNDAKRAEEHDRVKHGSL